MTAIRPALQTVAHLAPTVRLSGAPYVQVGERCRSAGDCRRVRLVGAGCRRCRHLPSARQVVSTASEKLAWQVVLVARRVDPKWPHARPCVTVT